MRTNPPKHIFPIGIATVFLCLLPALVLSQEPASDDGIWEIDNNGKPHRHVSIACNDGQVVSDNNTNKSFTARCWYPKEGNQKADRYVLRIGGQTLILGDAGEKKGMYGLAVAGLAPAMANSISQLFRWPISKRTHPGHRLDAEVVIDAASRKVGKPMHASFLLRNLSDVPILFERESCAGRDGQFTINVINSPGGPLVMKPEASVQNVEVQVETILPSSELRLKLVLSDWFECNRPGVYDIILSYRLPLVQKEDAQKIVWEDYVTRRLSVTIE